MNLRKVVAPVVLGAFAFSLLISDASAQSPWGTAAFQSWKQGVTAAGRMGVPRFTTAAAPTCNASNVSALIWDTTLTGLYVCNGSAYVAAGGTGISLNTSQTPDALYLATDALSNSVILAESADSTFDFAHAIATDPTLFIHSRNQSTTQWLSFSHNATDAVIDAGTGNILFSDQVGITGNNLGLFVGTVSSVNNVIKIHSNQTPDAGFLATGTAANHWIVAESGDASTDFSHAQSVNPSIHIQSADATQITQFATLDFRGVNPNRTSVTVNGATTFAVTSGYMELVCTGAETITGAITGTILYLENTDSECTIADDDAATAANAINLTGTGSDVGAAEKLIVLIYNGSSWYQIAESDN